MLSHLKRKHSAFGINARRIYRVRCKYLYLYRVRYSFFSFSMRRSDRRWRAETQEKKMWAHEIWKIQIIGQEHFSGENVIHNGACTRSRIRTYSHRPPYPARCQAHWSRFGDTMRYGSFHSARATLRHTFNIWLWIVIAALFLSIPAIFVRWSVFGFRFSVYQNAHVVRCLLAWCDANFSVKLPSDTSRNENKHVTAERNQSKDGCVHAFMILIWYLIKRIRDVSSSFRICGGFANK